MECQPIATSTNFGLTVSIYKTKHLHVVVVREACDSDGDPIPVNGGDVESVQEFP